MHFLVFQVICRKETVTVMESTRATGIVTETERYLTKISQGYKRAKAQQILRLLKDQDCLNQRFKDCALDEDDAAKDSEGFPKGNSALPAVGSGQSSNEATGSKSTSAHKRLSSVDPSRCRTSMGFYNYAECSEKDKEGASYEEANVEEAEIDLDNSFEFQGEKYTKLYHLDSRDNLRPSNPHRGQISREPDYEDMDFVPEDSYQRIHSLSKKQTQNQTPRQTYSQSQKTPRSSRPKTGVASARKQYRFVIYVESIHIPN